MVWRSDIARPFLVDESDGPTAVKGSTSPLNLPPSGMLDRTIFTHLTMGGSAAAMRSVLATAHLGRGEGGSALLTQTPRRPPFVLENRTPPPRVWPEGYRKAS